MMGKIIQQNCPTFIPSLLSSLTHKEKVYYREQSYAMNQTTLSWALHTDHLRKLKPTKSFLLSIDTVLFVVIVLFATEIKRGQGMWREQSSNLEQLGFVCLELESFASLPIPRQVFLHTHFLSLDLPNSLHVPLLQPLSPNQIQSHSVTFPPSAPILYLPNSHFFTASSLSHSNILLCNASLLAGERVRW